MTEFLDIPGGRIAYDVDGSGPLVVLSHGIGDRRQAYRFLAPMLAQADYRVANADLRGHGESSMGWAAINNTDVAGDLLALTGHLGGPAVIVGHSLSVGAATIAAATRPDLVAGVVEINPFTRTVHYSLGRAAAGPPLPPVRLPADRLVGVPQPAPVAALPGPGLPGQARRLRRLRGRAGRQAAGTRPDGGVPEDLQVHARRRREAAAPCQVPGLVIMGTLDPDFADPRAEGDAIAAAMPTGAGTVAMVDGAGHYPHAQCPEAVAELVIPFLKEHAGA